MAGAPCQRGLGYKSGAERGGGWCGCDNGARMFEALRGAEPRGRSRSPWSCSSLGQITAPSVGGYHQTGGSSSPPARGAADERILCRAARRSHQHDRGSLGVEQTPQRRGHTRPQRILAQRHGNRRHPSRPPHRMTERRDVRPGLTTSRERPWGSTSLLHSMHVTGSVAVSSSCGWDARRPATVPNRSRSDNPPPRSPRDARLSAGAVPWQIRPPLSTLDDAGGLVCARPDDHDGTRERGTSRLQSVSRCVRLHFRQPELARGEVILCTSCALRAATCGWL